MQSAGNFRKRSGSAGDGSVGGDDPAGGTTEQRFGTKRSAEDESIPSLLGSPSSGWFEGASGWFAGLASVSRWHPRCGAAFHELVRVSFLGPCGAESMNQRNRFGDVRVLRG